MLEHGEDWIDKLRIDNAMSTGSKRKARVSKEAAKKEIAMRYKGSRGPWSIYDGQIAALYALRRHRLEVDGDLTSADKIKEIIANMRLSRTARGGDKLGEAVELTDAERNLLLKTRPAMRTIAPCDLGKGERAQRAIKAKREREKHRRDFDRRAAGKPTRAISRTTSLKVTKPWEAAGVSRATW